MGTQKNKSNEIIRTLLKISRPRFYSYLLGPYAIGSVLAVSQPSDFLSLSTFLGFIFFSIPANLFVYGVNDLADFDTDQFNQKKKAYEHLLKKKENKYLLTAVIACLIFAIFYAFFIPLISKLLLCLFLFLAVSYSLPPIRFKARPFLDSYSNWLYILPGFVAYSSFSFNNITLLVFLGGSLWTAGMHTFSAIPDILADSKAGIKTTAALLGRRNALLFVLINWTLAVLLGSLILKFWIIPLFAYPIIPLLLLYKKNSISKTYRLFPYINALVGMYLFWIAVAFSWYL